MLYEAQQFLSWLAERSHHQILLNITIRDVFPVSWPGSPAGSRRRTSIKLYATNLRSFLRFLYISGHVILDLSPVVIGPKRYAFESIPLALCSDARLERLLSEGLAPRLINHGVSFPR